MRPTRSANPQRAFSLIELLVVVAIVALLAAIVLPSLAGVRAANRNTRCMANLRQIAQADSAYRVNHRLVPPMHRAQLEDFEGGLGWYCPADRTHERPYDYRPWDAASGPPQSRFAGPDVSENAYGVRFIAVDPHVATSPPRSPHGSRFNAALLDGNVRRLYDWER